MSDLPAVDEADPVLAERDGLPMTETEKQRILETVKRYAEDAKGVAKNYQDIGRYVEQYCLGNQWGSMIWKAGRVTLTPDDWFDEEGVDRRCVNIIQNVKLTLASLLTRDRPGVIAKPANADDAFDIAVADTCNRLIRYYMTELSTSKLIHQMVIYACEHGMAGIKVMPDPKTGAIQWTPQTIYNMLVDPRAQDFKRGQFIIYTHNLPKEEAELLTERLGIDPKELTEEDFDNAAGEKVRGVPTMEAWIRPTREYPKGLYAFIVCNRYIVETRDFPFVFGPDSKPEYTYPQGMMKMREIRDSAYGATNLADALQIQRSYNEVNNRIMKLMRATTNPNLLMPALLGMGEGADGQGTQINPAKIGVIRFTRAQSEDIKEMRWTETPQVNPALYDLREFYRTAMNDVVGINEVTSGQKSKSISGRAIENIVELDSQKNADATRSMQDAVTGLWELTLKFTQTDVSPKLLAKIASRTGVDLTAFMQADIQGANVRLEPSSELDLLATTQEADATDRATAGLPPQAQLDAAAAHDAASTGIAEQLITAWLSGQQFDLNPDDTNLDVVLAAVERHAALAQSEGRPQDVQALAELAQAVKQLAAQATQAQPTGDPNAPPAPAPSDPMAAPAGAPIQ
jgi:hypothetical protein